MYDIASIIASFLTPYMLNPTAWGWGAKMGFFWALCCATWTFFYLPEPKGRTYGEPDTMFEQGTKVPRPRLSVWRPEREGNVERKGDPYVVKKAAKDPNCCF
ncbi:hypothetical protein BBK36DRAFT_1136954 [Trichoderma citrinoviride]|uniref:Major facilitator superfamily (MFS) profile domain-containing protein n=1 Tax=Trichoderma citrinoviride TaxID=58853 RepID=A0A2T4BLY4_9HYPO|nr:hypothetical protein BBK36DRAFT_1136954 [Trichoderma citrinoviride]PTB70280.1 hypothetical protein BBK36DRAFT_1136954 [Trichoderma citrinoviride]